MHFPALIDFNLVAKHGGFSLASRMTGRPKATLSRRVAELEDSMGVRLIERGTRSLRLTEAGATLYGRTDGLLSEVIEVSNMVSAGSHNPRGRLRISAPILFAHASLGRIAASFAAAHPEVRLEVTAEDRLVDPVEEGYDIVIRINPTPDQRLVGRCFLRNQAILVASPSMGNPAGIEKRQRSLTIRAVVRGTAPAGGTWQIVNNGRVTVYIPNPVLSLSSQMMVRDAVLAGVGAALLPQSMVTDDLATGHLVSWGVAEGRQTALWALHTSRRLVSSKITAFLSHLEQAFPNASADFSQA